MTPELEKTMAVILNLPPAVEQQLKARAARIGQTLEEYLQRLALREAERSEPARLRARNHLPAGVLLPSGSGKRPPGMGRKPSPCRARRGRQP